MRKGKKSLILVTAALILTILSTSCTSCQKGNELYWPEFPDPVQDERQVVSFDAEKETVSMPLWYWKKIVRYVSDVEMNIKVIQNK